MTAPVLITGASSGIGLATAIAAARAGLSVVGTARDPDRAPVLRAAAAESAGRLEVRQLDVVDPASIEACVRGVVAQHGGIGALVNNAGVAGNNPSLEQSDLAHLRSTMEVNFFGAVSYTHLTLPTNREV